jgi:hypothetical protein
VDFIEEVKDVIDNPIAIFAMSNVILDANSHVL